MPRDLPSAWLAHRQAPALTCGLFPELTPALRSGAAWILGQGGAEVRGAFPQGVPENRGRLVRGDQETAGWAAVHTCKWPQQDSRALSPVGRPPPAEHGEGPRWPLLSQGDPNCHQGCGFHLDPGARSTAQALLVHRPRPLRWVHVGGPAPGTAVSRRGLRPAQSQGTRPQCQAEGPAAFPGSLSTCPGPGICARTGKHAQKRPVSSSWVEGPGRRGRLQGHVLGRASWLGWGRPSSPEGPEAGSAP